MIPSPPMNWSAVDDPGLGSRLAGSTVLIIEDDYSIATDLAADFESMGMVTMGPSPTIEAASMVLAQATPEFAVLDINIRGNAVFAIAEELIRKGVKVVFYTGYDPSILPEDLKTVPCLQKPAGSTAIVAELLRLTPAVPQSAVATVIPKLRRRGLELAGDIEGGDMLVEETLKLAISAPEQRRSDCSLEDWLLELIERVALARGNKKWN